MLGAGNEGVSRRLIGDDSRTHGWYPDRHSLTGREATISETPNPELSGTVVRRRPKRCSAESQDRYDNTIFRVPRKELEHLCAEGNTTRTTKFGGALQLKYQRKEQQHCRRKARPTAHTSSTPLPLYTKKKKRGPLSGNLPSGFLTFTVQHSLVQWY
jgi:hypothetical protein